MSRPTTAIKEYQLQVRLSEKNMEMLKELSEKNGLSKSEMVRNLIIAEYNKVK